jgi:hypothetical protein
MSHGRAYRHRRLTGTGAVCFRMDSDIHGMGVYLASACGTIRGQGSRPGTFAHYHRLNETLSGTLDS